MSEQEGTVLLLVLRCAVFELTELTEYSTEPTFLNAGDSQGRLPIAARDVMKGQEGQEEEEEEEKEEKEDEQDQGKH